jgi:hypothetical protein
MGSAQGKEMREGRAPQARREISSQPPAKEISSQPPARKETTWSRRREEGGVRPDEGEPACTE